MVLATNLLFLTGCASTSTLDWLRDEHATAIAEDLAIAVATRVARTDAPVFVSEMPLRDHFESAIRAQGYAVAAVPDDAIEISGLGERIPPNTWHVGLDVDDGIRIHRLYRIDQDDVQALSSVSVGDHSSEDHATLDLDATSWHLRSLHTPRPPTPIAVRPLKPEPAPLPPTSNDDAFEPEPSSEPPPSIESPSTAPEPVTTGSSVCPSANGAVLFHVGSLKRNLDTILARCGWTISRWPSDALNDRLVVDWIVEKATTVYVESVDELLAGLGVAYGLHAEIDEDAREIAFTLDDES